MSSNILNTQAAMNVTLLVDQYRHQHQAMDKYLNEYDNRQELEAALSAFYARQGITDVTPEMIKAGIEAYEQNRFTYKGVQGGWMARKVSALYLALFPHRFILPFVLAGGIAAPFLVMGGINAMSNMARDSRLAELNASIAEAHQREDKVLGTFRDVINDSKNVLASFDLSKLQHAKAMAQTLVQKAKVQLVSAESLLKVLESKGASVFVLGAVDSIEQVTAEQKRWVDEYQTPSDKQEEKIELARKDLVSTLQELNGLKNADLLMQQVEGTDLYARYKNEPDIITARANVLLSLKSGQGKAASEGASKLENLLVIKESSKALLAVLDETVPEFERGYKDEDGKMRLNSLIGAARHAAQQGNQKDFNVQMQRIQDLSRYVMTDLSVRLVDKPGQDTGFSRSNDVTKRYYLVLEAVDQSGAVVPHEVQNVETGAIEKVNRWAQRVDETEFRRVVADKKSDGVVDDYLFGKKPAGYYSIQYDRPHLNSSVTRW